MAYLLDMGVLLRLFDRSDPEFPPYPQSPASLAYGVRAAGYIDTEFG